MPSVFTLLQWLLTLRVFNPVLKPGIRIFVGFVAIPLFRIFMHRVVRTKALDRELTKDLEQWFRGSLLLLIATRNMESFIFGDLLLDLGTWFPLTMRILLAVGVIEAMPDQELFSIIYPGPGKLIFPKGQRIKALREQSFPFLRGLICRHIDRSSAVFAIMAAIQPGWIGWTCYGLAITQYLIIGLLCSKQKALDVLNSFDKQVDLRRQELLSEMAIDSDATEERTPHGRVVPAGAD